MNFEVDQLNISSQNYFSEVKHQLAFVIEYSLTPKNTYFRFGRHLGHQHLNGTVVVFCQACKA
jgi:hypothetical protein